MFIHVVVWHCLFAFDPTLSSFRTFSLSHTGLPQLLQSGVMRVNCIDCLDRTNVVQSMIAAFILRTVVNDVGACTQILSPLLPGPTSSSRVFFSSSFIPPSLARFHWCRWSFVPFAHSQTALARSFLHRHSVSRAGDRGRRQQPAVAAALSRHVDRQRRRSQHAVSASYRCVVSFARRTFPSPRTSLTVAFRLVLLHNVLASHSHTLTCPPPRYTGTGALKTDITRTGKRSILGALSDGVNSSKRYVQQASLSSVFCFFLFVCAYVSSLWLISSSLSLAFSRAYSLLTQVYTKQKTKRIPRHSHTKTRARTLYPHAHTFDHRQNERM